MTIPEEKTAPQNENEETYLSFYMKKYTMWLSILSSLFVLLNIIALFISTNFTFTEVFSYIGSFLLLFAIGANIFVWFAKDYFWALVLSIITGLAPTIEIIIHLATIELSGTNLILAIIALCLAIGFIVLPFILVYVKYKKAKTKI